MESQPDKSDVESRLEQTAEAMSDRLASLQEEVSSTGGIIRQWMVENPVKAVAGMLAMGLGVGLFFGGGRRAARRRRHDQLIDAYLDALRREVEEVVDRGQEPGPALEKALRDRVPLVVYTRDGEAGRRRKGWGRSLFQEAAEVVFSTGLSLLAREVIESVLDTVDVETVVVDALEE